MREILFRGIQADTGEWIYGYGAIDDDILHLDLVTGIVRVKCAKDTIGQFTGLLDKNGKMIFEGDTLRFPDCGEEGFEYKEGYDFENVADVVFNNGRFELSNFEDENSGELEVMQEDCHEDFISIFSGAEVIGTIYGKAVNI